MRLRGALRLVLHVAAAAVGLDAVAAVEVAKRLEAVAVLAGVRPLLRRHQFAMGRPLPSRTTRSYALRSCA